MLYIPAWSICQISSNNSSNVLLAMENPCSQKRIHFHRSFRIRKSKIIQLLGTCQKIYSSILHRLSWWPNWVSTGYWGMICQIHNIPCRLKNSADQPFDGFMRMYQIVGLYIAQDIQTASKAIFCGDVNLGGMSLFFWSMDVFTESWLRLNGSKTWCWTFDLFNL